MARKITHTEVPLTLPSLKTPAGSIYSIYGVVDMAQEYDKPRLYDIKTHAASHVEANKDLYQKQLNVYAKIWQKLHRKELDGISIVATKLPDDKAENLSEWNPLVPLDFDQNSVDETIKEFGDVVDQIEAQNFRPRTPDELYGTNPSLASELCSSCDGRFSCGSYLSKKQSNQDEIGEKKYLKQPHVESFTKFLVDLVNSEKDLNHAYFVPLGNSGFHKDLKGKFIEFKKLKDAFKKYYFDNKSYEDNKKILEEISKKLRNNADIYIGVLDCLRWGAGGNEANSLYKDNKIWIDEKEANNISINSILESSHSDMTNQSPDFSGFDRNEYRMNAGFTKIYALKFDDFIIYDGRVGAAFGLLVRKYIEILNNNKPEETPVSLRFPWGAGLSASTKITRNPSDDKYKFPQLRAGSEHAKWNMRANWILKEVANYCGDFWGITDPQEKLRALEAALFMIGYGVRYDQNENNAEEQEEIMAEIENIDNPNQFLTDLWGVTIRQGNWVDEIRKGETTKILRDAWVPKSHNFTTVAQNFCKNYNQGILENTKIPEFNCLGLLKEVNVVFIQSICNPRQSDLHAVQAILFLNSFRNTAISQRNWDGFPKYLMDAYLVGTLASLEKPLETLTELRYAGNGQAPENLKAVGQTFGRHFGFLDADNKPTLLFDRFFGTTQSIEYWIKEVIPIIRQN